MKTMIRREIKDEILQEEAVVYEIPFSEVVNIPCWKSLSLRYPRLFPRENIVECHVGNLSLKRAP